jgi:hypothetical protein
VIVALRVLFFLTPSMKKLWPALKRRKYAVWSLIVQLIAQLAVVTGVVLYRTGFRIVRVTLPSLDPVVETQSSNPLVELIEAQSQRILVAESVAIAAVAVTAIAAFSNLYFTWRNDSRLKKEQKLKIEMLELQLADLKSQPVKAIPPQSIIVPPFVDK